MSKFEGFVDTANDFLKQIDRTENYKKYCEDKISECDQVLSDLDHQLELQSLNAVGVVKNNKIRKQILKERRVYKDDLERVNFILNKMPNIQSTYNNLKAVKNGIDDINKRQSSRKFTPRVRTDLFSGIEANKEIRDTLKNVDKLRKVDQSGIIHKPSKREIRVQQVFDNVNAS